MGADLRHAVQIDPGVDFLAAARKLRALAASDRRQRRRFRLELRNDPRRRQRPRRSAGSARLASPPASRWAASRACRLRSGLTCFATLSHSARSSSLKPRLRRGGTGISGMSSTAGASWTVAIAAAGDDGAACRNRLDLRAAPGQRHRLYDSGLARLRGVGAAAACGGLGRSRGLSGGSCQRIDLRKQLCDFFRRPRVRHRHLAAARDGIEALRHQHDKTRIVLEPAGDLAGIEHRRRNRDRPARARRWPSRCPARSSAGETASSTARSRSAVRPR